MTHTFVFHEETETDHVFVCAVCGVMIGFNKPGIGEPNAVIGEGDPVAPQDADMYVTPCTGEVQP